MKLLYTTRSRLLAGALVVLASAALSMNSMQSAEAQPRGAGWERSSWWTSCDQAIRRVQRSAITTNEPASVTRSLIDLRNVNTAPSALALAASACREERVRDRRYNIPAYMCVGEAALMPTVQSADSASNAQAAYCAFHSAALLARQGGNAGQLSAAHVGRARALEAVGASQTEVIEAYNAAIDADRNATDARLALARHYVRRNDPAEAQRLLVRDDGSGGLAPIVTGTDAAVAIVELARARPEGGDYLRLLRAAERAAPSGSVGVNSALGAAYFRTNPGEARRYLWAATEGAVPQSPTEAVLQLDAYYYRSVIETQEGNYTAAAAHADAGGNQPQALRQACLVRLLQGRNAVYNVVEGADRVRREVPGPSDGQTRCGRLGATPEGQLLYGMFWLRRAQFIAQEHRTVLTEPGRGLWTTAVQEARTAFAAADDGLTDTRLKLNWPGHDEQITLRQMIDYGIDLRRYYGSRCEAGEEPMGEPEAESVFVSYKIVRARGSQFRCMPG